MGEFRHRTQLYNLENKPMSVSEPASEKTTGLRLGRKDGFFTVETWLFLPRSLDVVFPFFADAANLETLTPPWLQFEIVTPRPIDMHAGALIQYRLRLHGIPLRWQSEITSWEPPHRFVDEQRRGPYRAWIHEHKFMECKGGCEVRDFVRYAALGGWVANRLFVGHNVRRIFEYRTQKLLELFA
jgi:ligand-binding SRPBCC domain-containing protein